MKIKSLKLTDFKGFEELHIESFGKQTTAIIGNNGAGKSSIIEATKIIFNYLLGMLGEHKIDSSIINNNSTTRIATLSTEIQIGSKVVKPIVKTNGIKQPYADDRNEQKQIFINETENIEEKTGNELSTLVHIYPPSRIINEFTFTDPINFELEREASIVLESLHNFRHFFMWFENRENYENEVRLNDDNRFRLRELEAIRKAYSIFFPEFKKFRIKRTSDGYKGKSKFVFENGDKVLFFNQLSDGEQGIIALIGDMVGQLCITNPKLDDPLRGEAIIMIDEIELHLHPTWQRKIIKKLEAIFPNCQFIITTHSPQVLSELDAENDKIIAIKDFKAYEIPTVFGRETNWILETVMDTPARPSEFKNQLRDYFDLIAKDKLEEAEALRKELEAQTGSDEPEFVKADMLIRRKKAMKK